MRAKLQTLIYAFFGTLLIGAPVVLGVVSGASAQVSPPPVIMQRGTFTATFDDACSSGPDSATVGYTRVGNIVALYVNGGFGCTSDSTSFATTGGPIPSALRPAINFQTAVLSGFGDNGANVGACVRLVGPTGNFEVYEWSGTVCAATTWTAAGSKTLGSFMLVYPIR